MTGEAGQDRIARHLIVRGVVQGVFFRESTRRTADAHAVDGWVRNLADGCVEAHLEGPRDAVEAVIAFCRTGPPHAHVTAVEIDDVGTGDIVGFTIR